VEYLALNGSIPPWWNNIEPIDGGIESVERIEFENIRHKKRPIVSQPVF
jgi:hypothetical protein